MIINIYAPPECDGHIHFPFTAERSGRLSALKPTFENVTRLSGVQANVIRHVKPVSADSLTKVHDQKYIDTLRTRGNYGLLLGTALNVLRGDIQYYTRVSQNTFSAIEHATGSIVQAVNDTLTGQCNTAFCAVRPPGHHAGVRKGEGFCLVNNVAVGAYHALSLGKRVAVVDFDRHHGNGTMNIVTENPTPDIFFASSYQQGCGYAKNLKGKNDKDRIAFSIPKGAVIQDVQDQYNQHVVAQLEAFRPDILLISAGFDMHQSDPLSSIKLTDNDYFDLTRQIMNAAKCPVVSVLEGGYNEDALNRCVYQHLRALTLN